MRAASFTHLVVVFLVVLCTVVAGTGREPSDPTSSAPRPLQLEAIENAFRLNERILSGGQPEGEEAFRELRDLGVKTIISVDGAKPNLELAHKYGLRYIHLPIGYDGVSASNQLRLIKAGRVSEGPIFVHCHHGKHRGPAAAAVVCLGNDDVDAEWGNRWLKQAGTATNYVGLYRVVEEFRAPEPETLAAVSAEFPEQVTVSDRVDAMVNIDIRWEHLLAVQEAGYRAPSNHPDLDPANEALLLFEAFKELERAGPDDQPDADLVRLIRKATAEAEELHALMKARPVDVQELDRVMGVVKQSCKDCHSEHRD